MTIRHAFDLALQHHQVGRLADAEALYRQILTVQPNHADALHLLGVIAHQAGRNDLAEQMIRQALVLGPNNSSAYANLGEVLRALGRLKEAIASFRRAIELNPEHVEAHNNLANALHECELFDEAVAASRRAIELKPCYAEAHNNLGNALLGRGQLDEAIAAYRCAIQFKSDLVEAHGNLSKALRDRGQLEEAIAACRRALELKPDFAGAHSNLGNALRDRGQTPEAIAAYRRALELKPDFVEAHNNLGSALRELGLFDEAVAASRRALEFKPDYAEAHHNLSNALRDQGRLDEAVAAYRRALQFNADNARTHSDLVLTLHFRPDQDVETIASEQQRWNQRFGESVKRFIRPHVNKRDPGRQLRLGYVSPDFRNHAVGWNVMPLFECHDRLEFEILCYSGVTRPDEMTEKFQKRADHWRSTVRASDDVLAEMIRRDGVDILVDLSQHTGGNRLPVFARRPAPVQVSFAGYPESTGVEAIEYRISDRFLEGDAAGRIIGNKEQVCLIDSFWCYNSYENGIEMNESPTQKNCQVIFGNLNHICKINEPLLKLWAQVLAKVGHSRLVLLSREGSYRQRTLEFLEREGIESQRVEFVAPRPHKIYLELYHRLDIVLDTFPYNGHTTNLDALWMGVPVVSLAGATRVSRGGLSILNNLGLPELVSHAKEDYIKAAVQLAHDLPRLAELRATLRRRMEASVLMDAKRFTRKIETAYRTMWRQWCTERNGE